MPPRSPRTSKRATRPSARAIASAEPSPKISKSPKEAKAKPKQSPNAAPKSSPHGAGSGKSKGKAKDAAKKPAPASKQSPGGKKPVPAPKQSPASSLKAAKAEEAARVAAQNAMAGDDDIVLRVTRLMKSNKLSQVQVGQEARVSQAVISQWLARKYHGHNDKVDQAMEDWLEARANGTLHALVPPLTKDATKSVLRPSHHRAPPKKKAAPQMSKAQIQETIEESATGLTFTSQDGDDDDDDGGGGSSGPLGLEAATSDSPSSGMDSSGQRRKRKRPPQLHAAMGEIERKSRSEARATRNAGRLISPSEFAPVSTLGELETPIGMPTPGNTPWGDGPPQPFWATGEMRDPTPREQRGAAAAVNTRGGDLARTASGGTKSNNGSRSAGGIKPPIDVDSLLPPSPLMAGGGAGEGAARRSPRLATGGGAGAASARGNPLASGITPAMRSPARGGKPGSHFETLSKLLGD